jgi:SAM-dependent methyltransferase
VLELCCGSGLLLETLSAAFPHTDFIGVDISPRMVECARERLASRRNVVVLEGDWIYGFGSEWDHAFDVIIVKNALHVLDRVRAKLKDLKRVSHDRTTFIVVETVSPTVEANDFIKHLFHFTDPERLKQTFFTQKALISAIKQAGWTQYRPTFVTQFIDTEDWLVQRCGDRLGLEKARKLLCDAQLSVRRALQFDGEPGIVPAHMLRLQYIAGHVRAPAEIRPGPYQSVSAHLYLR